MNISTQPGSPASQAGSAIPAAKVDQPAEAIPASEAASPAAQKIETPYFENLLAKLKAEPEVRNDQIVRAMVWASDPNYPPMDALNAIAGPFVAEILREPYLQAD